MSWLKHIHIALFLYLLTLILNQSFGQELLHHHYTKAQGLSDNITYHFKNGPDGLLWIGTDNGLVSYDGEEFKSYLENNYVTDIDFGTDGTMWIGSWRSKIQALKDGILMPIKSNLQNPLIFNIRVLPDSGILAWNNMWSYHCRISNDSLLCQSMFLQMVNNKMVFQSTSNKKRNLQGLNFYLEKNDIWVYRAFAGVYHYVNDTTFVPIYPEVLKQDTIYSIHKNLDGYLCFAAKGKIIQISKDGNKQYSKNLTGLKMYDIKCTSSNSITFSTNPPPSFGNRKVFHYNIVNGRLIPLSGYLPIKSEIGEIHLDYEKDLWISTDGDGLYHVPYPYIFSFDEKVSYQSIIDIHQIENKLYFASKFNNYYIKDTISPNRFSKKNINKIINDLNSTPEGEIIFSTNEGLYADNRKIYDGFVSKSFCLDKNTFVICGTNSVSLKKVDVSSPERIILYEGDENVFINDCYIDSDGNIWLATNQGIQILKFNKSLLKISDYSSIKSKRYKSPVIQLAKENNGFGLVSNNILQLYPGKNKELWILTDKGLCLYKDKKIVNIQRDDDNRDLFYTKLLVDHNNTVWLGSKSGLHFYNGEGFGSVGYLDGQVNCLFVDNNYRLWVGGNQGVSFFDISNPPEIIIPPIQVDQITINGEEKTIGPIQVGLKDTIRLGFRIKTLNKSGLDYRFRLNNSHWQEIDQPILEYNSLRPGKYQVQIAVRKKNSDWKTGPIVSFEVTTPWWAKWWAMASGLTIFTFFIIYSFALLEKRKRKRENERVLTEKKIAELELKTLQAQLNPHFIFNALNSIQSHILDQTPATANEYLTKFSRLMRLFLESSKLRYTSLDEETELIKIYIELEKMRFPEKFDFKIDIDPKLSDNIYIPTMLIQPFVENAINHGLLHKGGDGMLAIGFKPISNDLMLCIIDDNGIGRIEANRIKQNSKLGHRSRALQITQEKLVAINTIDGLDINIETIDKVDNDGISCGTRVEIQIPIEE